MNGGILLLLGILCYAILDGLGAWAITKIFHERLKKLLKKHVNWLGALLVWVLMTGGLLIFVLSSPAVSDAGDAFSMGMIFGLVVYGVYECTNIALLKKRTWNIVLVDTAWGMFLCGTVSVVLWYLMKMLGVGL